MSPRVLAAAGSICFLAALPVAAATTSHRPTPSRSAAIPTPAPARALPVVPAVASGYRAPNVRADIPGLIGVTQQPFVGITLQNAIGMVLLRNGEVAISQGNRRIAAYQIESARGVYDMKFSITPSVTHSKVAPTNAFFAGPNFGSIEQNRQSLSAAISGSLPLGTQYQVGLSGTKIDDNTIINAFNPYYPSVLSASLTQPLLKNSGGKDLKTLILARISSDDASAQTLVSASQAIAQVENTYWDLVAAWRNVAIQEEALKAAIAQQHSSVRMARQGQIAPIDAVEASSQVEVFEANVLAALQTVASLENGLKELTVSDPRDPIWRANLVPTSPALEMPPVPTLNALLRSAIAKRPEMTQAIDALRTAGVNLAYARNQALPQLDLVLGYTSNGFAGQVVPPNAANPFPPGATPPPYLVGNLNQSLRNTFANTFPTYEAQLNFKIALGEHTEKADVAIAQQQQQIAILQIELVADRALAESRNALQSYETALARLAAARRARETSEQVLASELRRFHNGLSTTYLVLQRQVQVAQNRGLELSAQTDLNKAIVEIDRVSGDILTSNGVDVTTAGQEALTVQPPLTPLPSPLP